MQDVPVVFTSFRAEARVAAFPFRLRPAGAIRRELLIATSTFFTCGLLRQTGAQYSAAVNTRACEKIGSVLAKAPQVVPAG